MLPRVVEIDDLNRARKIWLGQVPNPFGTITDDDLLLRAAPTALPGFQLDALAKLFGGLADAGVGGGVQFTLGFAQFGSRGEGLAHDLSVDLTS